MASRNDAFKEVQSRHRKSPHLLTSELVDFQSNAAANDSRIIRLPNPLHPETSSSNTNYQGPLFGLSSHPGFVYAPSALSPSIQDDLAYLALSEYCEPPHRTNIDQVPVKAGVEWNDSGTSIWELWKKENGFPPVDIGNTECKDMTGNKRQRKEIKQQCQLKHYRSPQKLSWSTLGYHYDWTARTYTEDAQSPMPIQLKRLSENLARLVTQSNESKDSFVASAAIANYYHAKQVMGGHRDDLEFDFSKPVISISLGLPAVFLLGGKTRDEAPAAILARPGDVMFLAGESRLAYHGMARVMSAAEDIPSAASCGDNTAMWIGAWPRGGSADEAGNIIPNSEREAVRAYLSNHRVNINIRQVLPDDVKKITDDMKPPLP